MVITKLPNSEQSYKGKSKLISIKTDRIKLSVCVVYKESGNPMIVSVNTGDLDYSDMHITGSITRRAKHDVTFAIQFTNQCKYMSLCQRKNKCYLLF